MNKYKPGDIVIKKSGGNKMTIEEVKNLDNNITYKCIWFVEKELFESDFIENQIVNLKEYNNILKIEEREDKIENILK